MKLQTKVRKAYIDGTGEAAVFAARMDCQNEMEALRRTIMEQKSRLDAATSTCENLKTACEYHERRAAKLQKQLDTAKVEQERTDSALEALANERDDLQCHVRVAFLVIYPVSFPRSLPTSCRRVFRALHSITVLSSQHGAAFTDKHVTADCCAGR